MHQAQDAQRRPLLAVCGPARPLGVCGAVTRSGRTSAEGGSEEGTGPEDREEGSTEAEECLIMALPYEYFTDVGLARLTAAATGTHPGLPGVQESLNARQ